MHARTELLWSIVRTGFSSRSSTAGGGSKVWTAVGMSKVQNGCAATLALIFCYRHKCNYLASGSQTINGSAIEFSGVTALPRRRIYGAHMVEIRLQKHVCMDWICFEEHLDYSRPESAASMKLGFCLLSTNLLSRLLASCWRVFSQQQPAESRQADGRARHMLRGREATCS